MENFVVSARKYRPSTFESVIGQEHITNTLKNAIRNNQLAHAFLFCGPRGVGKTTCARILAKTINCLNITESIEACNECDSCKAFNQNASFNIYELDAASNNSVDDIRGLVEQVRYAPQGAKYKIYIIDEVHMLSAAAFNAFLKTLEEPPAYAKFILATTERHKILPTILSRCQVFDFHRIKIESAVIQLQKIIAQEGMTAEPEALHTIAQKADGAMRDALSIFDRIVSFSGNNITYQHVIDNLNILDYEYYFKGVQHMIDKDVPGMLLLFDDVLAKGFDAQHFLAGFAEHLRNLLMCKFPNTHKLLEAPNSITNRFMQQSQQCTQMLMVNALNLLNKCELEYKASKNPRLHVELTLVKLCHLQTIIDVQSGDPDAKKKMIDQLGLAPQPPQTNLKPSPPTPTAIASEPTNKIAPEVPPTEQPTLQPKPIVPIPKAGIANSLQNKLDKIKQQVQQNPSASLAVETTPAIAEVEPETRIALTESSLLPIWNQYLEKLANDGKKSLSVIYKNAGICILNESIIQLTLISQLEKEMVEEDKMAVLPYLRSNLKNADIDFAFLINQQSQPYKAFTAEDRFKAMAEKNPVLEELRQSFGLELE
ncbi:MAG: DNA polymerase III subunit gamma/tau [Bacteroidia bacterium]|jgi:DNA polymerase-3 subunit gamma/tau|nr:DNA polymerase III subunit gamma/tau [Bacteroidia bacterium]